jgi:alanyl-tRNA synthetase
MLVFMAMTQRLYYNDSYTTDFDARVVELTKAEDRPAAILDHTYFYPAGGGQPADVGLIGGVKVVDVLTRQADHVILHALEQDIRADTVECQVNWPRRFDHMQQHTGQHILTRAFSDIAGAHTIAFHLGGETVTIDLDTANLADSNLERAEDLANQIVIENHAVAARVVTADEFDKLNVRIRKMPDYLATDGLRVIDIDGFDITACGGTHVARTGEIGMIKILKVDRLNKNESRVEFLCGGRALRDYRIKNTVANQLAADLTVGPQEVGQAVGRLKTDLKDVHRALKSAQDRLLEADCADLLAQAVMHGEVRLVKAVLDGHDVAQARALASRLAEAGHVIALCGVPGQKAQLIFGRSANLEHDMNAILKRALAALGSDRGGGKPEFAQGGGVPADAGQIALALDQAEQALFE